MFVRGLSRPSRMKQPQHLSKWATVSELCRMALTGITYEKRHLSKG